MTPDEIAVKLSPTDRMRLHYALAAAGMGFQRFADAVTAMEASMDRARSGMLGLYRPLLALLTPAQRRREAHRLVRDTIQSRRLAQ